MKVAKKATLVILILAIFSNCLTADVIAVKTKARATDKGYFSLDVRRAKVAGQQEPEFKEEKPWPVPEFLGILLLTGVAVGVGTYVNHGGGH